MESPFVFKSFIDVFKQSIKNDSDHIALEYVNIENSNSNGNNLSFNSLDILSNYLSIYLKNYILKTDYNNNSNNNNNLPPIISVYKNHSFQLIISILSIFKLNLIYLPLDTSYPIDRLSFMLNDSNCNIIITTHQYHKNNQFKNKTIVCLDCLFSDILKNQKDDERDKKNWTKEQDEILLDVVNKNNRSNWKRIASLTSCDRRDIECHHRFYKVLLPTILKEKWSNDEVLLLKEQYSIHGKQWNEIAKSFSSKSNLDIKDYCEHVLKVKKNDKDRANKNKKEEDKGKEEEEEEEEEMDIDYDELSNIIIKLKDYQENLSEIENIKSGIEDPAYLIYTSGSTGNPKGVLVAHRGIVNFLQHQIKVFQFKRNHTRLLQSLPICFDASLSEIGTSLLGHCTLLIPKTQQDAQIIRGSSQSFLSHIALNNINAAMISPSFLSLLSTEPFDSAINRSPLETIVIGGETCPVKVLKKWRTRLNIVNVYGPTEATVCTTTLPIYLKKEPNDTDDYVSLGEVVPNMSIYLLDENTREPIQNIGGEGEIYIGGVGVALEYFNNENQTEKSFITDPFTSNTSKMFKTGDWGRLVCIDPTKKQTIEFRGRMDNQIKLNGSRIELDEISRTLENHQLIHQAVVDVKAINDNKILVAYLILKEKPVSCKIKLQNEESAANQLDILKSFYNSPKLLSEQFKEYLLKTLPVYMIPHQFIIMDSFPQNKNEKIDRSKLPAPFLNDYDSGTNQSNNTKHIPTNEESIKMALLQVVRQVLVNYNIESSDDLISNHSMTSILCTQIIEKCRNSHGIILTVFHIYILRTIDKITSNLINSSKNTDKNHQDINDKSVQQLKIFLNNFNSNKINTNNNSNNSININNGNNILILGSTGFLGSNILKSILNNTKFNEMNIYLLVRSIEKGNRLIEEIATSKDKLRIHLIKGDIGENQFGCSLDDWKLLCSCGFSTIIHSAANVNMNLPFDEMIKDNIKSTFNVIEFINQIDQNNLKDIHYISTLSTILSNSKYWSASNNSNPSHALNQTLNIDEDNEIIYGGYAQSKWLSEFIISNSNIKDKLFIHRPAMICPNLNSTNPNENSYSNYLNKLFSTCRELKSYPIGIPKEIETDITPIDTFVSNFIINILGCKNNNNRYYSYYTYSISLNLLFKSQLDQNYEGVPINNWIKKIKETSPFYPFVSFLSEFKMFERILFPGSKLPKTDANIINFNI
ncbi:hypothetical protein DICPUDRAFT_155440 [Dictyostelium purpureum]|uniref:Uncharacterized protein n=1 Tax=Dictyostelium purpureum TaxID=5786 RepID=F0ZU11_DICPU|nr:uncharacterized protein DICPUDRAFT_155440 [Dictyostelium purpureum]EGC32563.1 hypothetical protein DICPUDRAFT_155440 [Dictyostelium purpureum]|eukprot:XP_003290900.1 hypothetical protein DICPUDRAFT_155440 [Dictyostelium purpureum]